MLNKIIKDIRCGKFGTKNRAELLQRLEKHNSTIKKVQIKKSAYEAKKEMAEHYKELFEMSIQQVRFLNMQVAYLKSLLVEVKTIGEDALVTRIIDNGLERSEIDNDCQTRVIFGKNPKGFD